MNALAETRKHFPWRTAASALGGVLLLGALLLWVSRAPLAAWAITYVMNDQGLCPCEVNVISLGLSHSALSLQRSAIGSIARIDIDYRLSEGVDKALDLLRIEGARLSLAWHDGKLSPDIAARGGSSNGAGGLPVARIEVIDSSISLTLDSTVVVAAAAGTIVRDPQLVANFDLAIHAPQGQLHSSLQARGLDDGTTEGLLTLSDGELKVEALAAKGVMGKLRAVAGSGGLTELDGRFTVQTLNTPTQAWGAGVVSVAQSAQSGSSVALQFVPLRLALHSASKALTSDAPFTLDAALDARVLAGLLPGLSIGVGTIKLTGSGTTPSKTIELRELLKTARMHAEVHVDLKDVARTDNTRIAHIAANLACELVAGALTCRSPQGLQLDGIALPATVVAADSAWSHISTVQLSATDNAALIALKVTDGTDQLAVATGVTLQAPSLAVHGPLAAVITLDAVPPGADAQPRQGRFAVHGKLVLERPAAQELMTPDVALDGRFTIAAHSDALLAAVLEQGRLELPAQGWAVHGVSGRYDAGDGQHVKLTVAEVRNTREPALIAPLRADLDARIGAREVSVVAHLRDTAGFIDATVEGRHERRSGVGDATLSALPIVLNDGSALHRLSPAMSAGGYKARGTITVAGGTRWGDGPPRSALSLAVQAFALDGPTFKASAVDGELQLDSLAPLHSGPGQHLNGELELPSLKRVPFAVRFALDGDKVLVEQAHAELFNGAFEASAAEIDLKTTAMRMDLRIVDIDLESAFTVLNLEQLKGSGRITGVMPLRFEEGHLAVTAGHLEATGPGTVQIGASSVTEQLKSYGPDVDLAFRVLSDFHYQRLRIDADKTLLGSGKAMFHLEGDNPAVMNRQPFVFNIGLETDFDYLAKLLLELSATSNRALGWGAGEILKY